MKDKVFGHYLNLTLLTALLKILITPYNPYYLVGVFSFSKIIAIAFSGIALKRKYIGDTFNKNF